MFVDVTKCNNFILINKYISEIRFAKNCDMYYVYKTY